MLRFLFGLFLGVSTSLALAQINVHVISNGVLSGYIVQKDGKEICRDPSVWNKFRGPMSYIVCNTHDR